VAHYPLGNKKKANNNYGECVRGVGRLLMAFNGLKTFTKLTFLIALITTVLLLVSSYFLVMFLGPTLFFFTPEGLNTSTIYRRGLPIWLFTIVGFGVPIGLNVGGVFLFLWSIFAICFVAAWRFRESLHEVVRKGFSRPVKKLFSNCLFAMPITSSMMLIAVILIQSLQEAGGVPTGQPRLPDNPFEFLFDVSYAALAEEIGFRVIPIGAFLIIYLFWVRRKNGVPLSRGQRLKLFLTAPLFPDEAKRMVDVRTVGDFGIKGGISLGEWIMVFFTSIIFGLAHYLFGGGWEIGKITSVLVVGLAMGLTYLLYGFQAPILLHWFFNHYFWFFNPNDEGGLQFVSKFCPSLLPIFDLIEFTILIFGVLSLSAFVVLGLREMFGAIAKKA